MFVNLFCSGEFIGKVFNVIASFGRSLIKLSDRGKETFEHKLQSFMNPNYVLFGARKTLDVAKDLWKVQIKCTFLPRLSFISSWRRSLGSN